MTTEEINQEFKKYMDMYKGDPELGKLMNGLTFENLFNEEFLKANSKFTSLDDLTYKGGFGIMNLMEVENVNQEKWNEYITKNTDCASWHEFGKLAMIYWMKKVIDNKDKIKN